jgi:hypothetical protein
MQCIAELGGVQRVTMQVSEIARDDLTFLICPARSFQNSPANRGTIVDATARPV